MRRFGLNFMKLVAVWLMIVASLGVLLPGVAGVTTGTVSLSPQTIVVPVSSYFDVNINTDTSTLMKHFHLDITFDSTLMGYLSSTSSLPNGWTLTVTPGTSDLTVEGDVGTGSFVSGPQMVATLSFRCVAVGKSDVSFIVNTFWVTSGDLKVAFTQENGATVTQEMAVGGVMVPTNELTVLAPYLGLLALAGAVSAALVLTRKRVKR
jgi:hypothetical protein